MVPVVLFPVLRGYSFPGMYDEGLSTQQYDWDFLGECMSTY